MNHSTKFLISILGALVLTASIGIETASMNDPMGIKGRVKIAGYDPPPGSEIYAVSGNFHCGKVRIVNGEFDNLEFKPDQNFPGNSRVMFYLLSPVYLSGLSEAFRSNLGQCTFFNSPKPLGLPFKEDYPFTPGKQIDIDLTFWDFSTDSDRDGLKDVDEILGFPETIRTREDLRYIKNRYFSNPDNPDTDSDGLTDKEEIKVRGLIFRGRTSPTMIDSDGDGKNDNVDNIWPANNDGEIIRNLTIGFTAIVIILFAIYYYSFGIFGRRNNLKQKRLINRETAQALEMLGHIIVTDQKYNGAISLPEAQIEIRKMEISNESKHNSLEIIRKELDSQGFYSVS